MPTLRSRPSRAAQQTSSPLTNSTSVANANATAARRFYDTLDVRQIVLSLLDSADLAKMLRLEKAITASVAGILYREVTVSQMGRMSRANPRRATYCDAVKILDRNPPSSIHYTQPKPESNPIQFNPETIRDNIITWRKKFPNLTTILYSYPTNRTDDAYNIRIDRDGKVHVDLESRVEINVYDTPSPAITPPSLPPIPIFDDMIVRHTIAIRLAARSNPQNPDRFTDIPAWKQWLFINEGLDRRVTSIDNHFSPLHGLQLHIGESLDFITSRFTNACEPLTDLFLPIIEILSLDHFLKTLVVLAPTVGPSLRTLTVHILYLCTFEHELQAAVAILSVIFPHLEHLTILGDIPDEINVSNSIPLSGFPRLRSLTLQDCHATGPNYRSLDDMARLICRLGAQTCTYRLRHSKLKSTASKERFNLRVKELRLAEIEPTVGVAQERMDRMGRALEALHSWQATSTTKTNGGGQLLASS